MSEDQLIITAFGLCVRHVLTMYLNDVRWCFGSLCLVLFGCWLELVPVVGVEGCRCALLCLCQPPGRLLPRTGGLAKHGNLWRLKLLPIQCQLCSRTQLAQATTALAQLESLAAFDRCAIPRSELATTDMFSSFVSCRIDVCFIQSGSNTIHVVCFRNVLIYSEREASLKWSLAELWKWEFNG